MNNIRVGARQIYEELKRQIGSGVFGPEGALPSSRSMALELGVSRTTVTAAYEQLVAEGFIEVRQGARPHVIDTKQTPNLRARKIPSRRQSLSTYGDRVAALPPWRDYIPSEATYDFRYGDLAKSDFPSTLWRRAVTAALLSRPERLVYDDPRGSIALRTALQGYLWRSRRIRCEVDQVIVVNGSQQGLDLCSRMLLDMGDKFVVEEPGYAMARQIFSSTGATAVPIRVDELGLDTTALQPIEAKLAYVTPSHQFPLGGVLPASRRHQLLAWAAARNGYVVEDDYDSEFRYDIKPIPALHSLGENANVIYLGTVSKTLSPTMRIGYLVVPAGLEESFARAKQLADRHSSLLEQEALAGLIRSGAYEAHVRRVRRRNAERRNALLDALKTSLGGDAEIVGADAGLHLVLWLRQLKNEMTLTLVEKAMAAGVGIYPIDPLYHGPLDDSGVGLVMGYAALEPRQISNGVRILASIVRRMAKEGRFSSPVAPPLP